MRDEDRDVVVYEESRPRAGARADVGSRRRPRPPRRPPGRQPISSTAAMARLNLVMIHPFRDGNGRMARCLQTLILSTNQVFGQEFASHRGVAWQDTQAYYDILAETGGGHAGSPRTSTRSSTPSSRLVSLAVSPTSWHSGTVTTLGRVALVARCGAAAGACRSARSSPLRAWCRAVHRALVCRWPCWLHHPGRGVAVVAPQPLRGLRSPAPTARPGVRHARVERDRTVQPFDTSARVTSVR